MKKSIQFLSFFGVAAITASACATFTLPATKTSIPTAGAVSNISNGNEPYQITGAFDYTNDIINTYYVENAVALVDMYGFVTRNQNWQIPVSSQTLGFLSIDETKKHGTYTLQLPERPTGTAVDVAHDGKTGTGLQVFAVTYWPNLTGGPYSEGDDVSYGWPNYLASVKVDSTNNDEVTGGKLVVWAPDDRQSFPTGFGSDGKLFTADDPVGPIPAGYTIVDLDQKPFKFYKESQPSLTLYEPTDYSVKDFSNLSYTQAYDQMFQFVSTYYAFNGIKGKQPDWNALNSEIRPRVQQADQNRDANAFYLAMRDFTWAFKDGHTGLNGGNIESQLFTQAVSGGYGFSIRELDDSSVIVVFVLASGPADKAGIQVGATVTAFNGKPIKDAISAAQPWALPQSTDWAVRYQQARYLLRATAGTQASVTFTNPNGQSQTATLTAVNETQSFSFTSLYYGVDTNPMLPVEFQIINSGGSNPGIGYVKINSNYDDLNLIVRLFQRALATFQANNVAGIIIDMRYNSGGAPLGLAGFLTNKEIPLGQAEQFNDATKKYEPQGVRDRFTPNVEQYSFPKEVLLVGPACYSACEEESYGFSQVPGMIIVGQYSTSGTFADVARGQIQLPEGFSLQVPTIRFTNPDGSLFLEGTGVQPTIRVPVNKQTVLSTADVVLQAGEQAILNPSASAPSSTPAGTGVTPSGPPQIVADDASVQSLVTSGKEYLESFANETYTPDQLSQMNQTFQYTIPLTASKDLLWGWGWCASSQAILDQNYQHIHLAFVLDNNPVPVSQFDPVSQQGQGQLCKSYFVTLTNWPGGEHHLSTTVTFDAAINDGTSDYPAGKDVFNYTVYVNP